MEKSVNNFYSPHVNNSEEYSYLSFNITEMSNMPKATQQHHYQDCTDMWCDAEYFSKRIMMITKQIYKESSSRLIQNLINA